MRTPEEWFKILGDLNDGCFTNTADVSIRDISDIQSDARADLEARVKRLEEALRAANRLADDKYIPWTKAGGHNECPHGYSGGIYCPKCDLATVRQALNPESK